MKFVLWPDPSTLNLHVENTCAGADPNVRDWSGRKPRQYQTNQNTSLSADTYRSEYAREKPSSVCKLLLFSSLPRPKRRVKKSASHLSSLSSSHAVRQNVVNRPSKDHVLQQHRSAKATNYNHMPSSSSDCNYLHSSALS